MKVLLIFLAFLLGCLLLSSLIAWPLAHWFEWAIEPDTWVEIWGKLIALLLFFPLIRYLGLPGLRAVGWSLPRTQAMRQLGIGFARGIVIMAPFAVFLILIDLRPVRMLSDWESVLLKSLLTGIVGGLLIGLVEETFFRGAMLRYALRVTAAPIALTATTVLYAGVHFIEVDQPTPHTEPSVTLGLELMLSGLADYLPAFDLGTFVALSILGLLFAHTALRDGHIFQAAGLHAGIVCTVRLLKDFTETNGQHPWFFGIGSYDRITGWFSAIDLSLVLAGELYRAHRARRSSRHTKSGD